MNRNFNRKSNNEKSHIRLIIGIIFALFAIAPILVPFALVAIVVYIISKNLKNHNTSNFNTRNIKKKVVETKNNNDTVLMDTGTRIIRTDVQRQLESLKSLYDNGFMDKDEYVEKCKKVEMNAIEYKQGLES